VTSLAWSPNGRRLASASADESVRTWAIDASPGAKAERSEITLMGQGGPVLGVEWHPKRDDQVASLTDKYLRWVGSRAAPRRACWLADLVERGCACGGRRTRGRAVLGAALARCRAPFAGLVRGVEEPPPATGRCGAAGGRPAPALRATTCQRSRPPPPTSCRPAQHLGPARGEQARARRVHRRREPHVLAPGREHRRGVLVQE
jgi:hypothetical protein